MFRQSNMLSIFQSIKFHRVRFIGYIDNNRIDNTGTVMSDQLDKSEILVEHHHTVDKLKQSKVYLRYGQCDLVSEDCCEVVLCDI